MKSLLSGAAALTLVLGLSTAMAGPGHTPGEPQGNAFGKNGCENTNGTTTGKTPGKYFQAQADTRTGGQMNELLGGDGWLRTDTNLGTDNPNVVADWIARDCAAEPN